MTIEVEAQKTLAQSERSVRQLFPEHRLKILACEGDRHKKIKILDKRE